MSTKAKESCFDLLPEEWKPSKREFQRFLKNCSGDEFRGQKCIFWTNNEHKNYSGKLRGLELPRFWFKSKRRSLKQISYVWTHGVPPNSPTPNIFTNTCFERNCINGDHLIAFESIEEQMIYELEQPKEHLMISYDNIESKPKHPASYNKSDDNFYQRDIKKIKI